jgi:hypothetical protein
MFRLLADSKFSREAIAIAAVGRHQRIYSPSPAFAANFS